ncbi:phosphopentomutase-related metalloenzyme superfamily protein [Erysipelotrichaceae bacterium]|nr:phosphopentomutase-related metalloenzyme superfamily protein [Erysipelotrichaceae bacterium]
MARFIVVVLDSFGVGAMDDCKAVRKQDIGSNTALHILEKTPNLYLPNLESLGLMNILDAEIDGMILNPMSNYGTANLAHFGADSFAGHQEIMGTKPSRPLELAINDVAAEVKLALELAGHRVDFIEKDGLKAILVDGTVLVADNMETDLGQVINVNGILDEICFADVEKIGRIVRGVVKVSRVIVLGGRSVSLNRMLAALKTNSEFIGLDTPKSGLYLDDYQVIHLGYGVDTTMQVPHALAQKKIPTVFVGKVGDIVANPGGCNISGVDTQDLFDAFITEIKKEKTAFFCLNIQEMDLAGHAQNVKKYAKKLKISDDKIGEILEILGVDDVLIVMADHGNDPTVGHSRHTRERVPLLVAKQGLTYVRLDERETMADVGATVAAFFGTSIAYGTSFLRMIQN